MHGAESEHEPTTLDELVEFVASELMGVDEHTAPGASRGVLRRLAEHFEVDQTFLRFHDTAARTTTLIAEWPERTDIPEPDPLGVVHFEDADPIFAATEHLAGVWTIRPDAGTAEYQQRVEDAAGVPASSVVAVPLRAGERTTGLLGFSKFGDRGWSAPEIRALRTIGLLFAQTQASLVADARLRHLALHDELTGLPNRRALLDHLRDRLDSAAPAALLFVDVDRLKAMNDFLGHEAGDRYIVGAARRLRESVPLDHFVARLGGDEFVVVAATGNERPGDLALRVKRAMTEPVLLGGQTVGRTVSIGIALAGPDVTSVAEWLRRADQAVLAAKEVGGDTAVGFTDEMADRERVRLAVEMDLPRAIRTGALNLFYQPIIDLRSGAVLGAEALARWNHPELGMISPDLFVRVAETTNMAGELGEWVLDQACSQLACWRAEHPGLVDGSFSLAVNVSPVQLISSDFVDTVASTLARHRLVGADLTLEITEHAVVRDSVTTLATLDGLRRLGVRIAVDDFGTGYSSLAQIKTLPANVLKIDRCFLRDLGEDPDDQAIVHSVIGLARSLGLDLIAEGVETRSAADLLISLGCPCAQGHLFSRPVPPATLLEVLAASSVLAPAAP